MARQPGNEINKIIHETNRLKIMAFLAKIERVEFLVLREDLDLTDGNLSTHLRVLEAAGYISSHKEFVERKPKSWYAITPIGQEAFAEYVRVMQNILKKYKG